MFEIEKSIKFKASHKLYIGGRTNEKNHTHNWKVTVSIRAFELNTFRFVADYVLIEEFLKEIISNVKNKSFNDLKWFENLNPTAEEIAYYFFKALNEKLIAYIKAGVWINWVKVYKDEDVATYYPSH